MARYIQIAGVQFQRYELNTRRGQPEARQGVLDALTQTTESLCGLGIDLVVTSEAIESIGQTVEQAEQLDAPGPILGAYQHMAKTLNATVAGSLKLDLAGHVYNSLVYLGPDGAILGHYTKTYLTEGEHDLGIHPGSGPVVVETPAGRLGGVICFDLNFQDLREGYVALAPDILTFSSAYHGGLMQSLWAYQTRSFLVSALPFFGSAVLDPLGRPLSVADCYSPIAIAKVNLDRVMIHLDNNCDKFDAIRRQYLGEVEISVPPNLGAALLYSHSDKRTAREIAHEFQLEGLDDYMSRLREVNDRARST